MKGAGASGAAAPEALSSLRQRGLFNNRGDFIRMDDERGVAAGDILRLGVHPVCEYLLGLGCDDLVLRADHVERRFVMPSCRVDGSLERRVV